MNSFRRVYNHFKPILRISTFIHTIYFNFRYLPFRIALKLPIFIYKADIQYINRGGVSIDADSISPGMIKLGFRGCRAYPNNGIALYIKGKIVFKGKCIIGNDSSIIIGESGKIVFGDNFLATCSLRAFSFCGIEFGKRNIFGWACTVQDTNFHPLYDMRISKFRKGYGKIRIGNDNWFSQNCLVLHSVQTPDRCIFAARTVVTRNQKFESYSVHGGSPLKILAHDVMLDYDNYMISDYAEKKPGIK